MDACRGNMSTLRMLQSVVPNDNDDMKMRGPNDSKHHPNEQFILLYATTRGYSVPDDEEKGGNLTRSICEVFSNDKKINKYHLEDLFIITQNKVKKLCDATQCIEKRSYGIGSHFYLKKKVNNK